MPRDFQTVGLRIDRKSSLLKKRILPFESGKISAGNGADRIEILINNPRRSAASLQTMLTSKACLVITASLGFVTGIGRTSLQAANLIYSAKPEKYLYIWAGD